MYVENCHWRSLALRRLHFGGVEYGRNAGKRRETNRDRLRDFLIDLKLKLSSVSV